ncbi:MAG: S8 family serine peptidase [Lachnospiraceae bacterium]|nr:S8 family serine peptidase [Lachnospiraceae bacterium]
MDTQKAENLLNLAYNTPDFQRTRSLVLDSAVNPNGLWEIIVKGCCDLSFLSQTHPQIRVTSLIQNYAILTLPKELIPYVASLEEVIYVEMPKRLFFSVSQGILASCIRPVSSPPLSLDGTGTLVGIIDSGIDSSHPDFLTADGTSRIRFLWDQSLEGNPPEGYSVGTEYDQEQITAALREGKRVSVDPTGHGTAVAGIAAGNGRASDGQYRGVAPNADLIVVKMRPSLPNSFPRTAELMMGINYCVNQAIRLRMPLALNLSFGNNYGCHTGTSLVETFLDQASFLGQTTIVAGSGNEGASPIHTSGTVIPGRQTVVEFSVGPREPALDLQLWKNYADDFTIRLVTPSQTSVGPFPSTEGPQRWKIPGATLLVYYGKPRPYQFLQEIFLDLIPDSSYLPSGIWRILLEPVSIKNGSFSMWLPGGGVLGSSTRFLTPSPDNTLTIPSTASSAITVGAYSTATRQLADFSGRGSLDPIRKPDLVAPGVNITAPASPATYQTFSGTSFSAPFVTGSAALLMEWGIVRGNDPYLYGEKIKAALARSARQLPGFPVTPNPLTGYGALCLEGIV